MDNEKMPSLGVSVNISRGFRGRKGGYFCNFYGPPRWLTEQFTQIADCMTVKAGLDSGRLESQDRAMGNP